MSKRRPKHDKSRERENYTFHPRRQFHLTWDPEPGVCYLFALDERQAAMLRKMLQVFPLYHWVWGLPSPQRNWDIATEELWEQISTFVEETEACLMSGCDVNDLLKTNRMLVAALVGEAVDLTDPDQVTPDAVDYTVTGVVPSINKYLNHLEVLGAIPGAGDTIQKSLWNLEHLKRLQGLAPEVVEGDTLQEAVNKLAFALGNVQTLDDLIAAIENKDFAGGGFLDGLRDFLEIIVFLKLLLGGQAPVQMALSYWDSLKLSRWMHNDLTLKAYQATALRGIQYGITPFEETGVNSDEEVLEQLGAIPWLATAVTRFFSASPLEPFNFPTRIVGGIVRDLYDALKAAWDFWYEKYINLVGEPEPARTLTGVLTQISRKLLWDQDETGATTIDFADTSISDRLKQIVDKLAADGVTLEDVLNGLDLAPTISPTINVSCASCGSSGGCGCGGTQPPSEPGTEGEEPPTGWIDVTDDEGQPAPPGSPFYQSRKCKIANIIHAQNVELIAGILEFPTATWMIEKFGDTAVNIFTAMLTGLLGQIIIPIPYLGFTVGAALGWFSDIGVEWFTGETDLSELHQAMIDNEEDLVCALYNSNSALQAINDYLQVLADNGVSFINREFMLVVLTVEATNGLFYGKDDPINDALEAVLPTYEGPVNCALCGDCEHSGGYGEIISDNGSTIVLGSLNQDAFERASLKFSGGCYPFTISNISVISGTVNNAGGLPAWRIYSFGADTGSGEPGDIYESDTFPPAPSYSNVGTINIASTVPFQVSIDYVQEV